MKRSFIEEFEQSLHTGNLPEPDIKACIGILVQDATNRRLIEGVAVQLELQPIFLTANQATPEALIQCELIVADEPDARSIRTLLSQREETGEGVNPAVVAVVPRTPDSVYSYDKSELSFDGILPLPQTPAPVVAQLGLILYSHRAFARRYQDALEELSLNRRIFRSVTSGISVADATRSDLPLIYVNPAFEVMTGYSFEEVQGRNCRFLQNGERDQAAITLIREALRDGRETVAVLKNFRKDGSAFWNELSLSPIRNRDGALTHFVGIQNDVTARVEFEAALRESEKLAAVGRLASSIAHEINNPLESVMNLLYLAERSDAVVDSRTYLQMADRELQRVKLITSQSLRFYKQSTRPQAIACTELADSVLDLYHSKLQNSRVAVERRGRSAQSIVCMESEIRQVLNNLVGNAVDAMHGQGGKLLVRTREATEWRSGERGVAITVADTGSGMAPETLRSMYKAFYTTKGIGGTGLGLWISSEIVARHRGRLIVRSSQRPGASGTVFQLFLPFQGLTP
ncbi:PAS domain S-box-containing protein [Granulicella rosea]|uniref:histidine kinase n=1 Tax=Granulicella rosea TaxID=474952 RepID=A0A239CX26_9BACT|nr:PAS domain S-box protein [Granulicella rosea]SNS24806.1 PAS domain S-box-containing protein [Granulicella rosea]